MKCLNCDKDAVKRGKFCSRSCSSSYHTKGKVRNGSPAGNCTRCNKKLSGSKMKFCSAYCHKTYRTEQFIKDWLDGKPVKTYVNNRNEAVVAPIRNYLFNKHNNSCVRCGWSKIHPVTNKVPLQINHIDGDHRNNNINNLELICPNCHSLTPNFGALNKGRGRKNRYAALVVKEA